MALVLNAGVVLMPFRLHLTIFIAIMVGIGLLWSHVSVYRAGAAAERLTTLNRSVEVLRERNATDDQIRNLDDAGLCRKLGGLPDECARFGL